MGRTHWLNWRLLATKNKQTNKPGRKQGKRKPPPPPPKKSKNGKRKKSYCSCVPGYSCKWYWWRITTVWALCLKREASWEWVGYPYRSLSTGEGCVVNRAAGEQPGWTLMEVGVPRWAREWIQSLGCSPGVMASPPTRGRKRCQGHLENLGEEMGDQILQEKQSRLSSSHIASGSQTPEHYVEHKIWLSHCSERKQAGWSVHSIPWGCPHHRRTW